MTLERKMCCEGKEVISRAEYVWEVKREIKRV